ncbi:MAG: aminopeptidase P family protein [Clostridia bacterium]|nr:aminopeptidase P family protein [Clostridia bacterium]
MSQNKDELYKLKKYVKFKRLSSKLCTNKKQAALITSETNIRYLTDFPNSEGVLLVTAGEVYFFVDFRYGEAAQKQVTGCRVIVFSRLLESLKEVLKLHGITEVLFEASYMTVKDMQRYKNSMEQYGCTMITNDILDSTLRDMRIIKSAEELEKIEAAQKITEEAYLELLNIVKPGVSERKLAFELEFLMRRKGADGISFDLITIAGKKTSMPHGVPDDYIIQSGDFVTFDIGALYDGYHSDMTRTIAVKEVSEYQKEIYNIVYTAQMQALSRVKAGVTASVIDKTARDIIENAGYGEYFRHSTGHGVGLNIHEEPFVSPKSNTILSENMVITVEPGIYLPDKFGVRIEDMVRVTKNGCYNFATLPKELIVI